MPFQVKNPITKSKKIGLLNQIDSLFFSAIVIMEYGASLTYEDQIIDMEDPNFLVPKAAGGNNRSTTPLSQESTDSCHNNEAFEKGKIFSWQSHLYFFTNRNSDWKS